MSTTGGVKVAAFRATEELRLGDVQLVRWPADAGRRDELAAAGVPRVLLVPVDEEVPDLGELEDWIRVPADERDLWARMRRVALLHRDQGAAVLDDRCLRVGPLAIPLSPGEHALLAPLLHRRGELVLRHELDDQPGLDTRIFRLRRRLTGTGLTIHTVRNRGYVLDVGPQEDQCLSS